MSGLTSDIQVIGSDSRVGSTAVGLEEAEALGGDRTDADHTAGVERGFNVHWSWSFASVKGRSGVGADGHTVRQSTQRDAGRVV